MNDRQTLVDRILARFANIKTANGYQTNVGAKTKEWQTTPLDENELTTILVRDPIALRRTDPNGENSSKHTWATQIIVDLVFPETGQSPAEARKGISDINKAVGVDQTWGGLAKRSEQVSERLIIDQTGTRVGGAQVIFNVITSRKPWEA